MKTIVFFICCFISIASIAQVTNEVEPRSWSMLEKSMTKPEPIILPRVDEFNLVKEDSGLSSEKLDKSLRVGKQIGVDLNLFNSGTWTTLSNGDRIWQLNVVSKNAKFTRVTFDLYSLPNGAELYLYNNSRTDKIGPYTSKENQDDGVLGSWVIEGENLWIEYYEPKNVKGLGRVSLAEITHGYVDIYHNNFSKINESGACNVDVLCNPNAGSTGNKDWRNTRTDHINSVSNIVFPRNGSLFVCTGSMIRTTEQNRTPYFLTANHCVGQERDGVGSSFNANSWSFGFQWFANDQDKSCATFANTGLSNPQATRVLSGAQLRANNDDSDFALFELNQMPPASWNLFYAGWDRSGTTPTEQLGMHHPAGDIMKLCRNDQPPISETLRFNFNGSNNLQIWRIADWDYGVTEGGSSGSFLLNENNQIIGQLAGGFAQCAGTRDDGTEDWYGRFDVSWNSGFSSGTRLRDWLDPNNTGLTSINGAYYATLNSEDIDAPEMAINIYPNPSTGLFTIDSDQPVSYQVYNLNGQLINESAASIANNTVDISTAAKGLYFIKLNTNDGQTITKKLIKQ